MDEREYAQEREYLAKVMERLSTAIRAAERSLSESDATLVREQERMWEEGRHIVRDIDDAVELLAQSRIMETHHRSHGIVREEYQALRSILQSPYFGRIDFQDSEELLRVYIGRRAFIDSEELEFFVYDWRSPIASMFYDFDCGPAQYNSPQGIISGEMSLKRQYRITNGTIEAMYDANALVQDEILGEILSRQAGHSLKVIAESIQREQNQAIRFLTPRNMLISGPAGSGKTSVGLHHVAYLLYHSRGRLSSREIVAVSANHAFNEYIASILPDLFEADIRREVFADIIAPLIPGGLRVGEYLDQVEYLLTTREDDRRARWIAHLYSMAFLEHIAAFVDSFPIHPIDIVFDGGIIATKEQAAAFLREGGVTTYQARLQRLDSFIRSQCEDHFVRNAQAVREGMDKRAATGEIDIYTEQEASEHVQRLLRGCISRHQAELRRSNGLNGRQMLIRAAKAYAQQHALPALETSGLERRIRSESLYFEDMLALLCVMACMGQIAQQTEIRHVLVDEAQDYGVLQHFLLRAIYPRAVFTLLADTNQAVLPCIGIADAGQFAQMYPGELASFPLEKSYRSTGAIGALAASLIAHRQKMTYYDREGAIPKLVQTDDIAAAVTDMIEESNYAGTTAVLTKTRGEATRLYAAIGKRTGAALLTQATDTVNGQINILPFYLSKGLEFDRVITVLSGDPRGVQDECNLLFLCCTRALHDLYWVGGSVLPEALARAKGTLLKER